MQFQDRWFEDKYLRCFVCGRQFLFDAGEQGYFALFGLKHQPKRCPDCRRNKRRSPKPARPSVTPQI